MNLGALRAKPLSVAEALAGDSFVGEHVGVHGILFFGSPWTDQGFRFVLLPKTGGFDGVNQDYKQMTLNPDAVLEVREPTLRERLQAGDVPILTGGASYNIDAILIGRIEFSQTTRKFITDLSCAIFQRASNPELYIRQEICVVNFEEHLPPLPWHGQTVWPEVVPQLQLFPSLKRA